MGKPVSQWRLSGSSLRTRLIILAVVATIPPIIVVGSLYVWDRARLVEESSEQAYRLAAVLAAGFEGISFERLIARVSLPDDTLLFLVGADGRVLSHHPKVSGGKEPDFLGPAIFTSVAAGQSGSAEVVGPDDETYLIGFAPIPRRSSDGIADGRFIAVGFSRAHVLGTHWQELLLGPGLIAGVGVLMLAVILFGLHRIILANLDRLLVATSRVQAGDLTARSGLTNSAGEIGQLGQAFDAMASALELRETEIKRSNAELEQFAYAASHDLQEPLRAVSSYSDLLRRRYGSQLDERAEKYIDNIAAGAARMRALINDLLAYSRITTRGAAFAPVDCEAALGTALANLNTAIGETGATVTHDPLPHVHGDAAQLARIFQNLIANAIKFHGERPPEIHVSAMRETGIWRFSVRDNGIGIETEARERIFRIFQRLHTRGSYPGTGIGLAICARTVERHGGQIWVESEPGQGATFFFTLPSTGMEMRR